MQDWAAKPSSTDMRVAVLGAGIIGLTCAVELAARGATVTIFEKSQPGRGASWAAAGMLAPAFEAANQPGQHPHLFELCRAGAALWPQWAKRLEAVSQMPSGFYGKATLAVAMSVDAEARLRALQAAMVSKNIAFEALSPAEAMSSEPALSGKMRSALRLPTDMQVDNRATLRALLAICQRSPRISLILQEAALKLKEDRITHDGFDATLVCAGWQTAVVSAFEQGQRFRLADVDPVLDEIDCYGGQMLSVHRSSASPMTTIRADDVYIVPKTDRTIIGATVEPGRTLDTAEAHVIADLKQRAAEICPAIRDVEIIETWAGIRPGTHNHAPILGQTTSPGLYVASGHYRNGILLAPLTAQIMADMILDGSVMKLAGAFSPGQFMSAAV